VRRQQSRRRATVPAPYGAAGPPDLDVAHPFRCLVLDQFCCVTRSSASASCISAMGRSNARRSSAWEAPWAGAINAARISAGERGAFTPRVRASSSAVSGRDRAVEMQVQLGLRHLGRESAKVAS
jgi:hypothetical protein